MLSAENDVKLKWWAGRRVTFRMHKFTVTHLHFQTLSRSSIKWRVTVLYEQDWDFETNFGEGGRSRDDSQSNEAIAGGRTSRTV